MFCHRQPQLGRPLPKLLSLAEVEALLDTASKAAEAAGEGVAERRAVRLYALLETLYATGLRVSELLALPRGVLVADDRVLTIKGKGGRERLVPLNDSRATLSPAKLRCSRPRRRKARRHRHGCSPLAAVDSI